MPNEHFFRQTIRERIAVAQTEAGNDPAKVTCMLGNEVRTVEVMVLMEDEDYICVRTDASVQRDNRVVSEKILLHIHLDHFILVELA